MGNLALLNLRLGPRLKKREKIAKKSEISILLRVTSPKMKIAKLLQWSIRGLEKLEP